MTFDELPRWMCIWIVVAVIALIVGLLACIALGILLEIDQRNQQ